MMRNLLIGLFLLLSVWVTAQTPLFTEGFEGTSVSLTSQSTSTYNWAINSNYYSQGVKSDSSTYGVNDTVYLVSNAFSTVGSQIAFLEFDHICKVEVFDIAFIEVSNDNGSTWSRLTTNEYQSAGSFYNNRFNEASYVLDWGGASTVVPAASWWRSEKFDISSFVANSAQVKIRFAMVDLNANGAAGRYGWLLDNIKVWKPSDQEASLVAYSLPYAMTSGCGLGSEEIRYTILNNGATAINGNLTASFKREGQSTVTETVSATILPGDTYVYTFTSGIDLYTAVDTNYEVKMWINLTNDVVPNNDSIIENIISRIPLVSPVFNDTTIAFGANALLHATHPNDIKWYSDRFATNKIGLGEYLQTPNLYDTTTYYLQGSIDQTENLITTFANNSQSTGNMFDIKAFNTLTIDSFYVNAATNSLMEIWYMQGSYVGHNTSDSGWVKLGEYLITNAVVGSPTLLPIGGLTIPAGQTYGICVTYINGSIKYTFGNGSNEQYQDANMKITCGHGGTYFNYTNNPRVWNGNVFYHVGDIVCPSKIEPLTVNISGFPLNDAGLDSISPTGSISLNTSQAINVRLYNEGTNTLTACSLQYSVNGNLQPAIAWTGSLIRGATAMVNLGNYTFNSPIYDIKAWVWMPNNVTDQSAHNDTVYGTANSCLSGTMTLGGPTADIPDFATLQSILNQVGVCGNTTVNILPGVYNEQIVLSPYMGLGANSQLIFQSSTGNPADVVIQYTANGASDNFVVKFDSASYITLRNLTIKANDLTNAVAVYLTNGADHNTIDSNILFSNSTANTGMGVNMDDGAPCSHNNITNNKIQGGYYGIYAYGIDGNLALNNVFDGNEITDFMLYGANIYYQKTASFSKNKIRNLAAAGNVFGLKLYRSKGCKVAGNDVLLNSSGNQYGLQLYYCDSTPSVRGIVSNNMVVTSTTSSKVHYGIYLMYSQGQDIVYNSVYNSEGSSSSILLRVYNTTSGGGTTVYNNNLHNAGDGYAIYVRTDSYIDAADYNNIYAPNSSKYAYWDGGNYSNLASLKSAFPNRNQHSISVDAQYVSSTDLHSTSAALDGAATPFISLVNYDFDGDVRDSVTPDIGADEYVLLGEDAGVISLTSPIHSCPGDSAIVMAEIGSWGVDTLFSYTINWKVDGVLQTPITHIDTLLYAEVSNQYVGKFPFTAGTNHQIEIWTSMPNGMADLNPSNDSLLTSYKTSLAGGTYTIGGSNPDYVTFNDLAADLNLQGICGPVVFEIASGTYVEQFKLTNINGVSSTNTITFQSASGDSSSVVLTFNANSIINNHVVTIENTSHVSFKNMTLQSTSSTHSNVLVLDGKPSHISIQNCVIQNTNPLTSSIANDDRNLVHGIDSMGVSFHFEHSKFINGNKAISLNGGYATKSDWVISHNEFSNNAAASVVLSMASGCKVESNTITNTLAGIDNYKAISISISADSIRVTKNKIEINANASCQALSVNSNVGGVLKPILIANNFIHLNQVSSSNWGAGIEANGSKNISILHNNVLLTGTHANSAALQVNNTSTTASENLTIKNNVFATYVSGGSIYRFVSCDTSSYSNDYNALYNSNGGFISGSISSLAAWKTATNDAAHSMVLNPYFVSNTNLHVLNNLLNGAALPIASITDDIDNEIRNTNNPDIGADEFTPSPIDVAVLHIRNPVSACGLTSTEDVTIVVKNTGSTDITSGLQLSYRLNNSSTPVQETVGNTVVAGDSLVYTFAAKANLDVSSLGADMVFNITAWADLTGDIFPYNDTVKAVINSNYTPAPPVAANVVGNYGASASLSATSSFAIKWFNSDTSTTAIGTSNTYQTPILYDTTQYWATANTANCSSAGTMVQVNITGFPAVDAGISGIAMPNSSVGYLVDQEFKVTLTNYGTSALTSVWIHWNIDNQLDSMLWTGSLAHGQDSIVAIDTVAFTGGQYQVTAWTAMPNATVDNTTSNDLSSFTFNVCMMGTYTIGNISSGSLFDFVSFTAAINELSTGGICGPVTFMVDAGTYEEHLLFPTINGASATDRITFTSITGDSTTVKIHFTLSSTISSTIAIEGQYYTFSKLTISATNGNTNGRTIELSNGAKYNEVLHCVLEGENTTSTSTSYSIVYSNGGNNEYNTFKQNLFLNGSHPLYLVGGGNLQGANIIEENTMLDFARGSYFAYQEQLQFNKNIIRSTGASFYGVKLDNCQKSTITKNNIHIIAGTDHNGIYLYNSNGTAAQPNLVANNMVLVNGASGTTGYGVEFNNSSYTNFYHNTVKLTSAGGNAAAIRFYGGSENNIVNNNFMSTGGGYCYYIASTSAVNITDYNNIYNTSGDLGYYSGSKTSLSAFQAASGKDLHSISVDPLFYSATDLHSISAAMNNLGTPLNEVRTDIDGQVRSLTNPDMGADEFSIPNNDASIIAISSPTTPVTAGVNSVKVDLSNFGAGVLTSATIAWEVNSVAKTSFAWTGSLNNGATASAINIGTHNFTTGTTKLKIWVENPNNSIDGNHLNDTIIRTLVSCNGPLSGTYTIGGTGADYSNIGAAISSMQYCGISADVIFNIAPGTYNEQVRLQPITGASASATITFQSATMDSTDVIVINNSSTSGNYTWYMDGADFIRVKHITIEATNTITGYALVFANEASNNIFESNIIKGAQGTTTASAAIYSDDDKDNYNTFRFNSIENGYYGVYMEGQSASTHETGLVFEYNIFSNYYLYGANFLYSDNLAFNHNILTNGNVGTHSYGLYLEDVDGPSVISYNKFTGNTSSSSYGLLLYDCDATSAGPALIYNNFISVVCNAGSASTVRISNSNYQYLSNNNILMKSPNTAASALRISTGANNKNLNNCISVDGHAFALYVSNSSSFSESDYNNIYSNGYQYAYYTSAGQSDLSGLQAITNKDANSVSADPLYISDTDLHVSAAILNNVATPLSYVLTDIDGEVRNTTAPDIGADEFTPAPIDVAVVEILEPVLNHSLVGGLKNIKAVIKNMGSDTLYSVPLAYKYGNSAAFAQTSTHTLYPGDTTAVLFTLPISVVLGQADLCVYTSLLNDLNFSNDTLCINIAGLPLISPSVCDDFEGQNVWAAASADWQQGTPSGTTINTAHSGVNAWTINLATAYDNNSDEFLYSPFYDFSSTIDASLSFWRNNSFLSNDGFNIEYTLDAGASWISLGTWGDPLGTNWYNGQSSGNHYFTSNSYGWVKSSYDLSSFNQLTFPIQFRFHLISDGSGTSEGVAFDDFCIEMGSLAYDAGVVSIDTPIDSTQVGVSTNTISVTIKNYGDSVLTAIPVKYKIGTNIVSETAIISGGLAPDSITQFTFVQQFNSPISNYLLCAYTALAGDISTNNDQVCKTIFVKEPNYDAAVTKILSPSDTVGLSQQTVSVRIKNLGLLPFSICDVQYYINTPTNAVVETWTGSALAQGDSVDFTFVQPYNPSLGQVQICAKTLLANDAISSNDQQCKVIRTVGFGDHQLPLGMKLYQNVPNPTNGLTSISFEIPTAGFIHFQLVNSLGLAILQLEEDRSSGKHSVEVDASVLSPGIYYYTLDYKGYRASKKLIVK
jgi:parallel beta-helix repeat protein